MSFLSTVFFCVIYFIFIATECVVFDFKVLNEQSGIEKEDIKQRVPTL